MFDLCKVTARCIDNQLSRYFVIKIWLDPDRFRQSITNIDILYTAKHLGYFNCMFRLSQLHQCHQGMLPNWRFIEEPFH